MILAGELQPDIRIYMGLKTFFPLRSETFTKFFSQNLQTHRVHSMGETNLKSLYKLRQSILEQVVDLIKMYRHSCRKNSVKKSFYSTELGRIIKQCTYQASSSPQLSVESSEAKNLFVVHWVYKSEYSRPRHRPLCDLRGQPSVCRPVHPPTSHETLGYE